MSFTYNGYGQRTDAQRGVTGNGTSTTLSWTKFGYDARGRLSSRGQTFQNGTVTKTLNYFYDGVGNLVGVGMPNGGVGYGYDADNRLTTLTHRDGKTTKFGYDAAGRRVTLVRGNGTRADAAYNANGFLSLLNGPGPSTSFSYELAASGKRLGMTSGGQTTSYGYDNAGRLLSETSLPLPALPSIAYTLDAVGNRKSAAGFSYSYNANDWLLGVGGLTYGYDANGALTTVNSAAVNAYDFEGHLTQSGVTHFTYDAEGNRLSQTSGAGQTFYLQDTSSGLAEVVEEYDAGGGLLASYDYAGSELIREDRSGASWYTHLDGLGSVRALSDANGMIVATYTYDAFGNVVAGGGGAAAANPYRYAGAAFDTSTGLYYLRARYYDPQAGRFLSQDPFSGRDTDPTSLHRYLYTGNDPVNVTDPTGNDLLVEQTLTTGLNTQISTTDAGGAVTIQITIAPQVAIISAESTASLTATLIRGIPYFLPIITATLLEEDEDGLPIYFVDFHRGYPIYGRNKDKRFRNIARGITLAIGYGQPSVLTYDGDKQAKIDRRIAGYGGWVSSPTLADGTIGSWDEYPFASTLEGGAGAHITAVTEQENKWHGIDYLGFLTVANIIRGNQKRFRVAPIYLLDWMHG